MAIKIKKKKSGAVEEIDPILEQDQFLQSSDKSITWASQNRQKVIIAVVVIAAIAIIGVFLSKYNEKSELERTAALSDAVSVLDTPIESATPTPPGEPAAAPEGPRFPTSEAKYKEVEGKADAVLTAYPNEDVAQPAKLIKARAALGLGRYEEATNLYQEWLDANPDAAERPIILQALASAQAAAGKPDAAVAALESLVKLDKQTYGEMASYQIGRIYDTAGNKEKAKVQYDAFIKEYPESGKLELVKLRREAL